MSDIRLACLPTGMQLLLPCSSATLLHIMLRSGYAGGHSHPQGVEYTFEGGPCEWQLSPTGCRPHCRLCRGRVWVYRKIPRFQTRLNSDSKSSHGSANEWIPPWNEIERWSDHYGRVGMVAQSLSGGWPPRVRVGDGRFYVHYYRLCLSFLCDFEEEDLCFLLGEPWWLPLCFRFFAYDDELLTGLRWLLLLEDPGDE
jgi:hypothetical protein